MRKESHDLEGQLKAGQRLPGNYQRKGTQVVMFRDHTSNDVLNAHQLNA